MTPPSRAERFHALVRGETRGPMAWAGRAALWWARLPYGLGVSVRNQLFDAGIRKSVRVPVPVVSIGNLTLGGTGKTPCVEYVAGFYRDRGFQVAILSRGYGADLGRNDEAMVLEENLPDVPHLQGANRVELALTALQELESEVLVLDDGFQHRRLARDLDFVLLDATRPVSGEYLFPRGLLREPVSSLRRADVIVLTRCDQVDAADLSEQVDRLRARYSDKLLATAKHAPLELLGVNNLKTAIGELIGKPVGAFCGLGNPEAFRRTLVDLGAILADFRSFPDHHSYTREDVAELDRWAATLPADAVVVTTQKDYVKLQLVELAGKPVWALRIGMRFREGEVELQAKLAAVVEGRITNDE